MSQASKLSLQITGMTCAACAARLEKGLSRLAGVSQASVNLATGKASLVYDPAQLTLPQILQKIEEIGYGGQLADLIRVDLTIGGMT